jgi:pyrroloquinoline quinone biosynthesis protein E
MIPNPLALIAEVTHRCPLHCVYCSNPLRLVATDAELSTEEWVRVFREASRLGVLHLHLTGGEPAARADLKDLIAGGRQAGLYTNLITSGLGLSESRLGGLVEAGLDHSQLSFQDSRDKPAKWIAGANGHAYKIALARKIRQLPVAFTVNLVVHRQNLDHIDEMIEFIEQLQPQRMELAHTQYYGWALKNRDSLLPTPQQLENCLRAVEKAQLCLSGKVRIDSVVPDYYARYPKACMGGWGRRIVLIDTSGQALTCHAAGVIPGMKFDNISSNRWNGSGESPQLSPSRGTVDAGTARAVTAGRRTSAAAAARLSSSRAMQAPLTQSARRRPTIMIETVRSAAESDVAQASGRTEPIRDEAASITSGAQTNQQTPVVPGFSWLRHRDFRPLWVGLAVSPSAPDADRRSEPTCSKITTDRHPPWNRLACPGFGVFPFALVVGACRSP